MIEMLKVIILGIVQGITEWLPVSSTGHMILVDEFLKLNQSQAFMSTFFCGNSVWFNPCCTYDIL